MVAALNQDFVTYKGDTVIPIFTVLNSAGNPVDISGATQITWTTQLNLDTSALITKTKTGGQITFVTNGTDGKFQVAIQPSDTTGLSGFYIHVATLTDGAGNVSTVTVGRMQVGVAPAWTYNPMQIAANRLYQVRALIGDVMQGDQQLMDAEINWQLTQFSNANLAAAACARMMAFKFARQVDIVQGQLRTTYSMKSKQYFALAKDLEARGYATSVTAYAGGISVTDVQSVQSNQDRIQPEFTLGMSDNFLPVGPVGVEQPLGGGTGASAIDQF
jgi:hypothetical protein